MIKSIKNVHYAFLPIICALVILFSSALCFGGANLAKADTSNLTVAFSGTNGSFDYGESNTNANIVLELSNGDVKTVSYSGTTPGSVTFSSLTVGETYTLKVIAPTFTTVSLNVLTAPIYAVNNNVVTFTMATNFRIGCVVIFSQETWFTDTTVI